MTSRAVVAIAAACVIVASAFPSHQPGASPAPSAVRSRHAPDTLEVRVVCDGHIALTLRDPRGRAAYCGWDSTRSAIPGCRAFSMVEIYDEMGEDGVSEPADSVDEVMSDTSRTDSNENVSPEAGAADTSSAGTGTLRFVVSVPQSGEWLLDACVPSGAGYLGATLWLDVRIAPNRGASHVAFGKWAELKPGGRVWTRLRVGRDGSVGLIRTMTKGDYVWPDPERGSS
jgi:hypothetical protein